MINILQVCIVGAGPSGIDMTLKLKKLGYKDLTIFEKTGRVGGKSYDINYQGVPYPLGTVFLEPTYFDNIVPLAREYNVGEVIPLPDVSFWTANNDNSSLSLPLYYVTELSKFTKSQDPVINIGFLVTNIIKYIRLHKELFGDYEGDFMLKPSNAVMRRIRGTFIQFLKRENLEPLKIIFKTSHELQGYGYLDEISALYGLLWNKPKFMNFYALRSLRVPKSEPNDVYLFRDGYEKIWKTIVEKENLNVKFHQDIYSLRRKNSKVLLKLWTGSFLETISCDFLIWSAPMKEYLRTAADATHEEWSLMKGLKPEIFTASLVNVQDARRNFVYNAYLANLNSDTAEEGGVTANFNMKLAQTLDLTTTEDLEAFNQNNLLINQTFSVLQLAKRHTKEQALNNILKNLYFDGFGASSVEILQTISWEYFYRWSPQEMEDGALWKMFDIQGKRKTWFIGSSVSFEAVRSVMEYNSLLLRNMIP